MSWYKFINNMRMIWNFFRMIRYETEEIVKSFAQYLTLIHWGKSTYICINEQDQHCSRLFFGAPTKALSEPKMNYSRSQWKNQSKLNHNTNILFGINYPEYDIFNLRMIMFTSVLLGCGYDGILLLSSAFVFCNAQGDFIPKLGT